MLGGAVKKVCMSPNVGVGFLCIVIIILLSIGYFHDKFTKIEKKIDYAQNNIRHQYNGRSRAILDSQDKIDSLKSEKRARIEKLTNNTNTNTQTSRGEVLAGGAGLTPYCQRTMDPNWTIRGNSNNAFSLPQSPYATFSPELLKQISTRNLCVPAPQKLGILTRSLPDGTTETLPLMGHPTRNDNNRFVYFAVDNTINQNRIEIPGTSNGGYPFQNVRPEIQSGETINIPNFGDYTATVYPYMSL